MQAFRATLTDDAGQAIADVEGSIEAPGETPGPRQGTFAFQDTESFMQGVLESKTFRLEVTGESPIPIRVDSVSTTARPGYSKVEFTCS